jgi:hypothetical protein
MQAVSKGQNGSATLGYVRGHVEKNGNERRVPGAQNLLAEKETSPSGFLRWYPHLGFRILILLFYFRPDFKSSHHG